MRGAPYLKQERRGAILGLTMDSPQDRNALSTLEQVDQFTAACLAEAYNEERTHQGRWCFGKTPMRTFIDSLSLAKEKSLQAA